MMLMVYIIQSQYFSHFICDFSGRNVIVCDKTQEVKDWKDMYVVHLYFKYEDGV